MTLDDLDEIMRRPDVGSVTLSVAANGKAYCTVYIRRPNGEVRPENQWAASSAEGLRQIVERMSEKDDEDLLI